MIERAIALRRIIALFGIWCEGRDPSPFKSTYAINQNTGKSEQLLGKLELLKVLESDMETMKLRSHIGCDGILLLQMPAEFQDIIENIDKDD